MGEWTTKTENSSTLPTFLDVSRDTSQETCYKVGDFESRSVPKTPNRNHRLAKHRKKKKRKALLLIKS